MRLGKVTMDMGYVVDLDNEDMVSEARDCMYEDLTDAVKYDELKSWITVGEPDSSLNEGDIPEFLSPDEGDEDGG